MSTAAAPFSNRLLKYKARIALSPGGRMLVVKDQILMPVTASPVPVNKAGITKFGGQVANYLKTQNVRPTLLTTVFAGLPNPGKFEDVAILKLALPSGVSVYDVIRDLRDQSFFGPPGRATPNHVLIPAANEDWCPHGPPSPVTSIPSHNPVGDVQDITVIDAGYMWNPPTGGPAWGTNPLEGLCSSVTVRQADWLQLGTGGTAQWQAGTANVPDANGDGKLDALAGHANFVAGVIAQESELPNLHIWSHNSGFKPAASAFDDFSTEAAICRSLVMSQQEQATPVIQIGHETAFFENVVSVVWGLAFARIGKPLKRDLKTEVVITAPAGNQGFYPSATVPRFPAALGWSNPAFSFVKGVASHKPSAMTRTAWSNHGPWVTCSASGELVESTFLHVNMPVEDLVLPVGTNAPAPPRNFTGNSWARWNGTSFAAPKVAAHVAARLSPSTNASQAWTALVSSCSGYCPTSNEIGIVFPF